MGRHVVWTLVAMPVKRVAVGDEPGHEALEIAEYVRIGIFLYQEACGGMSQEEGDQSVGDAGFCRGVGDARGDVVEAASTRVEYEGFDRLSIHLAIVSQLDRLHSDKVDGRFGRRA